MKKITSFLLIALFALGLSACSGSKSYFKKGQNLEKSGLSVEAANFYIEALKRKRTNDDAMIALKNLGQKVLDEKYGTFYKNYTDDRYKEAVYAYIDAEEFKSKVSAVGVQLNSAPYYKDYYEEARDNYINELYAKAQKNLDEEAFINAEQLLNEIKRLDPSYKNVSALSDFAFLEPKYRQALRAYDVADFRKAYTLFKEINNRVSEGYKESHDYEELALESAQYAIGILPAENKSNVKGFEEGITGSVIREIQALNDPFIKLIDRSHTTQVLQEQFYNMSGAVDRAQVLETGTMLGTNAIFVSKLVNVTKSAGSLRKTSHTGWLGKEIRYVDPVSKQKKIRLEYSKVYYYEYEQTNKVTCTYQYQLISTTTAEVLLSDVIEVQETDQVEYATFNGDSRLLVAGYWTNQFKNSKNDRRYDSYSQKRELDQKLKADKNITDVETLASNVFKRVGKSVAAAIAKFNPEA